MNAYFEEELKRHMVHILDDEILFEPNNHITQRNFRTQILTFLTFCSTNEWIRDYIVSCDHLTNPPEVIEKNCIAAIIQYRCTPTGEFTTLHVVAGPDSTKYEHM